MKKFFFHFLFFWSFCAIAQQANDCVDAITVCGNTNISSNASGFGIQELDANLNPCGYEEINSLWLKVTIAEEGTLAFIITPNDSAIEVDYDFFVYGPNTNCSDFNNPIRCNTTNPLEARLLNNQTGLLESENNTSGGPGALGSGYASAIDATADEEYYILVDRPHGNGGFNLEWTGTARFLPGPEVNTPSNIEVCANTPNTVLDLTEQETQITTDTTVNISYFITYSDAFDNKNAIPNPEQFIYSGNYATIYVRVTNRNGCFEIVNFNIAPLVFDSPPNLSYYLCDSDHNGIENFNITQIISDAEASIDNIMEFSVSLHTNEIGANGNTNLITSNLLSTTSGTIFARITSALDENCFITYPIVLEVIEAPFPEVLNLVQCDIDEENSLDGITQLNLEQVFLDDTNIEITYFQTIADRNANISIETPENYINRTPFSDTVFYRNITDDCEITGEIALEINPTTVSLNVNSPIIDCGVDDEFGTANGTFNIEDIKQASYNGMAVAFYANRTDLALEQNQISGNLVTESTLIYARIETNNECQGVEEITLEVKPKPIVDFTDNYVLCSNGAPLLLNAPNGFDSYTWYKIATDRLQEIGNSNEISITEAGDYQLEVGILYEENNQSTVCSNATTFVVRNSNKAIITNIDIENSSENSSFEVFVSGDGDYEFAINTENYQNEAFFDNLSPGFYNIKVRDKNGCGITEKDISIIGFPKFFTPNGDGINDFWQIIGAYENDKELAIHIYDRYGKLMSQFNSNDQGWGGKFNGQRLPEADYWFKVDLLDGKQFQGHFSLKR